MNAGRKTAHVVVFFAGILCGVAALPESVQCATYYVDNLKGMDTNNGLAEAPWATLNKANKSAKAGDIVVITSNGLTNPYREAISVHRSGTPPRTRA